jgi:hypothetical protein
MALRAKSDSSILSGCPGLSWDLLAVSLTSNFRLEIRAGFVQG